VEWDYVKIMLKEFTHTDGHYPVMLPEVLAALAPLDGQNIVDCTFGGGSYSRAILQSANCNVIGLDRDKTAIERGNEIAKEFDGRLKLIETPFSQLADLGLENINSIVMDIGVSSYQIDIAERGFSFAKDGPLDMRMGDGETAAEVLATRSEKEIADIFWKYGEEKNSRRIARAIVNDRGETPFISTLQLAGLCSRVYGHSKEKIHPATRVFQALRIYVNDELGELESALVAAYDMLPIGGRIVVVTFHSLEDRIVKNFFNSRAKIDQGSRYAPINTQKPSLELIAKKPILPSDKEISQNPRSRSAKLRGAIKI
jgi:16S rRNA (cytosine1402-N4)-methyltransferase